MLLGWNRDRAYTARMFWLLAFAIGLVAGSRSMMAPAVVSWAVMLKGAALMPTLGTSWLAFMASNITAWIFGFLAVGELIADKLRSRRAA